MDIPNEPYHDDTNEEDRVQGRSYASSVVSTQSAPPPYELYPPAKTAWGKFYNWIRKIPRINTHQAIYLPTLSSQQPTSRRREERVYWSYYYALKDRIPRWTLPPLIAQHRWLLVIISTCALLLFSFLLFCSLFFAPGELPPQTVQDKVSYDKVRFLTLNIFMRPPLIRNNWSDYKDERLEYIQRHILPHYDVIVFQEAFAFASRRKDRLIAAARRMGFNHHIESPRKYPWDLGIDGGLLLISRFPIRQSQTIEYPRGQHADWFSLKGALHALVELNSDQQMHVYTTHTQASYDLDNLINQDDTLTRLNQFSLLKSFVQETSKDDQHPIVIAGDLNVDAAVHRAPIKERSIESSPEYVQMVDRLGFTDLEDIVYSAYGYHPVTFGDYLETTDGLLPAETVLTDGDQWMSVQSIDRIFWVPRNTTLLVPYLTKVDKFSVKENTYMTPEEKDQASFTQISDHYGLSCIFQII